MRKGDLTVIIARFAETPARKFTFSRKLILSAGIAFLVLVTAFVLSNLHYYRMWKQTSEYERLRVEADQLRKENETFRRRANQLTDQLSALEVTSKKLTILSGLESDGLGGLGGPTTASTLGPLRGKDLIRELQGLNRRKRNLEIDFQQLQQHYTNRSLLLSATPSIQPVQGYASGGFGYRADPFNGTRDFHPGLDISAPVGTKIIAPADGVAVFANRYPAYGKLVVLEHRFGISTRYGHLSQIVVLNGQKVKKGDIIGYVGATGRATGPHLHYEVRLQGQPLNPFIFLNRRSQQ